MARVYDEQAASLAYSHDAMQPWQRAVKRTADILCSSVGLVVLLPVFIVFAVMLRIQRNGPVFFSQKRIGLKGKPFTIYKFRTLSTVVEDQGPQLIAKGDSVQSTPFERFLRDHHLDELPQLWNVLIGNMSFVGPRTDVPGYADQLQGKDRIVLTLRPGITGPATLKYRNEEELLATVKDPQQYNDTVIYPDKVRINRYYAEHYSFIKDIQMIFCTVLGKHMMYNNVII